MELVVYSLWPRLGSAIARRKAMMRTGTFFIAIVREPLSKPRQDTKPEHRPIKTLERVLSKAGLCSRSEARSWIGAGRVRVNGKVIQNPDHWIDLERDTVTLDG